MAQMIRINLLDWRQQRREQREQRFYVALGAALLGAAAIVYALMFYYDSAIEAQEARNAFLEAEIAEIDKQIEEIKKLEETKQNLITRMEIIEQLQRSRAQIVRYFDELVNTLPEGVYLTSVTQANNQTTINGVAESNGRVSSYMRNLDNSAWFTDPRLIVITTRQAQNKRRNSEFTLTVKSTSPDSSEDEEEDAAG